MDGKSGISTKKICMTGLFAAIAGVLMLVEIPLWFAPGFYKIDLSEIPVLILSFAYGPGAGVIGMLLKILIKLLLKGTSTAFVGELANFIVGCSFVLPAGIIYKVKKTRKRAVAGCIAGGLVMTVFGAVLNGVYLVPAYARLFGMPIEDIVNMAHVINPKITDLSGMIVMCVVPFNLLKAAADSLITMLIYKRISIMIH